MKHNINHTSQGIVYKKSKGYYFVRTEGRSVLCSLAARLRKECGYTASTALPKKKFAGKINPHVDPLVVGDAVRFIDLQDGSGQIIEILPRQSKLERRAAAPNPAAHTFEQGVAANVDQVVAVFALTQPKPKWNMLDRYLVLAEARSLPALICITKLDLAASELDAAYTDTWETLAVYRKIGYRVLLVSALGGQGITELQQALHGRASILVGKSGVGKTSLLNAILPAADLRVQAVNSASGKGRHTTTALEMYDLPGGGAVVDTPGQREFGLWDVDATNLAFYFPEMRPFLGKCKFAADCQHDEEPGCAVRRAVSAGAIDPRRYQSYMRLKETT